MRAIGYTLLVLGSLIVTGEIYSISFPTARWFFSISRELSWLHFTYPQEQVFPWFGWASGAILTIFGLWIVIRSSLRGPHNPEITRRLQRFREIKRGYISYLLLLGLFFLSALDQVIVGKRALAVQQNGKWLFPAFSHVQYKNKDFGMTGPLEEASADYRLLERKMKKNGQGKIIMPPVPYDPTGDTSPPLSSELSIRHNVYYQTGSNHPFSGIAAKYYDIDGSKMHLRAIMRNGRLSGAVDGWDATNTLVYTAEYRDGAVLSENYSGATNKEEFLHKTSSEFRAVNYHPAPPNFLSKHWLGTTSQGYDVVAYLYGGLQLNLKATLIFLPLVYIIGIFSGMLMGFFAGWLDMVVSRLIEILSNMPFLLIVITISTLVPGSYKGLGIILVILTVFGWMEISAIMRAAAYRDRERDYISAARVLGAGTSRIIFHHLLPNTVSIIITLVPFTVTGLIFALTSLDYLGFGVPPEYATWGTLLRDGLENVNAPWLASCTFVVIVGILLLITFVGEAVREAFDPKKFTYYR